MASANSNVNLTIKTARPARLNTNSDIGVRFKIEGKCEAVSSNLIGSG